MRSILLLLGLLLSFTLCHAADFTSVQDGKWEDPATWGTASAPGLTDNVTIEHEVTMDDVILQDLAQVDYTGSLTINPDGRLIIVKLSGTNNLLLRLGASSSLNLQGNVLCGTFADNSSKTVEIRTITSASLDIDNSGTLKTDVFSIYGFTDVAIDGALYTKGEIYTQLGYDIVGLGAVRGTSYASGAPNGSGQIFGHDISDLTNYGGKWIATYTFQGGTGDWESVSSWLNGRVPPPASSAAIAISHPNPSLACRIFSDLAETGQSEGDKLFISNDCKLYILNDGIPDNGIRDGRLEIGQFIDVDKELIIGDGGFVLIDDGGLIGISNTDVSTTNTGLFVEEYGFVEVGNNAQMLILNEIILDGPNTSVNVTGEVWTAEDLTIDGGGEFTILTPGAVVVGDIP